jgi:FtsP/CotA-like multicopper oxidase with cupredoxin domain
MLQTDLSPSATASTAEQPQDPSTSRDWLFIAVGLVGLVALLGAVLSVLAIAGDGVGEDAAAPRVVERVSVTPDAAPPTLAQAKGVAFEKFARVDPTLPAVPAGAVKRFTVDVDQHVVQVDPVLAPTQAWTYAVNGKTYPGTAASPPIVVEQGDRVSVRFVNGGSKAMNVNMAHSIDLHSAEVDPGRFYINIQPGKSKTINFVADHPGVFMYHCSTQPVLMHVGNGMAGMMVVKPKGLPKADRELWITQAEYYLGAPGTPADMNKLTAGKPDVIAFNGYANQYKTSPIAVRARERLRVYVLNAGPTKWSAFHVIGTIFDRAVVENTVFHDSQTMNLAPSQGGWAEFTLDQPGTYPFVTHSFGDMVKGAAGVLRTSGAPRPAAPEARAHHRAAGGGSTARAATADVTLGDRSLKAPVTVRAGHTMFSVVNTGAAAHRLAIVPAPVTRVDGRPDVRRAVAAGSLLPGGAKETVMADLEPGRYEVLCLISGHDVARRVLRVAADAGPSREARPPTRKAARR